MPGFNLYLNSNEWMFATESLLRYHLYHPKFRVRRVAARESEHGAWLTVHLY